MKKLDSSLGNMVLSLTGFSVLAGALLGMGNDVTKEPIEQAQAKILSDAIAVVVPGFDNNPVESSEIVEMNGVTYTIYNATKKGELIGAAVESSADGFGGKLTVLVGFDKDGNILDYSLLSHSETPGLGSKADMWFKKNAKGDIIGRNPGEYIMIGDDIVVQVISMDGTMRLAVEAPKDVKVVLHNLFFALNSAEILPESSPALDDLYRFMSDNPEVHILITGHTDNTGSLDYNMKLSAERAGAVYTALVERGITPSRITYEGRGPNEPVATNDTEEGRAANRRVEFTIQ